MKIPKYQINLFKRLLYVSKSMGFEYQMNTPFFGVQIFINYKTGAVLMIRFDDYRYDYPNGRQFENIVTAFSYIDSKGIVHNFTTEFNK